MSIFKDTLHPFVQNQLEARKRVVSQWGNTGVVDAKGNDIYNAGITPRKDNFLRFTTGKNAWVKMQSFVDIVNPVEKGGKVVNAGLKIGSKTYFGSELARKYILEGGTLFEDPNQPNKFTLRSGVGQRGSIYASDLDIGGDRPLGYRPMPGITSVQVNNKSAYGSLREATIKFYAWDKHQLEELELLYMRTGYSVLLEWGWSQYLNSSNLDNIKIENFLNPTIDIFYDKEILQPKGNDTSDEVIYSKIDTLHDKTYANYDAMLGYVKNFSWQLMSNGGFECTTVLISRGEVISTLKLNSNGPSFTSKTNVNAPPLSLFENVMLNYSALINEGELSADPGLAGQAGQFATGSSPVRQETKDDLLNDLNTRLTKVALKDYNGKNYSTELQSKISSKDYGKILLTEGNVDGIGIEYIQMDVLISIINLYFNFKDQNNKIISQILIPKNTPCLAGADSVSIDPTTCIIYNDQATWITDRSDGAFPKTLNSFSTLTSNTADTDVTDEQFLSGNNLGRIGNIFISIPKILDLYRNKGGNNSDVSVIDFLKDLLNQVSISLGGVNDFQLHTTKSTIQIIDVKYLERGAGSKKYTLDLLGLKSVCRDVKITSRIFESQSSMIAIAAQSKANIGDIYSSTQNQLNKGLRDRILVDKVIYDDSASSKTTATDRIKSSFGNLLSLRNYLGLKCLGTPASSGGGLNSIIYPTPEEVSNAASLQKTVLLQADRDDLDFKAIIPFELEIVLDGISGLVQGQIFKVDTSILPSRYHQSNIGFIITGLSHSLQNNDWITSIKTQICLLDNEKIPKPAVKKDELGGSALAVLQQVKQTREKNIILWNVVADYMTNIYTNFYGIIKNESYNKAYNPKDTKPFGKTTPREAMAAYYEDTAGVYYPFPKKIGETNEYGNDAAVRFFTSPYRTYDFMYQKVPDRAGTYEAGAYEIDSVEKGFEKEVFGVNPIVIGNNEYSGTFGYMVSPNIQEYFDKVWYPRAKTRYKNDPDKLKLIEALASDKALHNSVRAVYELSTGQVVNVPFPTLEEVINKFISYPVRLSETNSKIDVRKAIGNPIPLLLKDNFMLRSPEYVSYIKDGSKTTSWNGDPNSAKYFNIKPLTFFFEETKDKNGQAVYNYKQPLSNIDVFNQCYRYICENSTGVGDYFDSVPVELKPVAGDIGNSNKVFSAIH
jgi:hypothetical protein